LIIHKIYKFKVKIIDGYFEAMIIVHIIIVVKAYPTLNEFRVTSFIII